MVIGLVSFKTAPGNSSMAVVTASHAVLVAVASTSSAVDNGVSIMLCMSPISAIEGGRVVE